MVSANVCWLMILDNRGWCLVHLWPPTSKECALRIGNTLVWYPDSFGLGGTWPLVTIIFNLQGKTFWRPTLTKTHWLWMKDYWKQRKIWRFHGGFLLVRGCSMLMHQLSIHPLKFLVPFGLVEIERERNYVLHHLQLKDKWVRNFWLWQITETHTIHCAIACRAKSFNSLMRSIIRKGENPARRLISIQISS